MLYSSLRNLSGVRGTGTEQQQHHHHQHHRHHHQIGRLLSSRIAKLVATATVACLVALLWIRGFRATQFYTRLSAAGSHALDQGNRRSQDILLHPHDYHPGVRGKGRLHLLIPATSTGGDLCKLLLSAQVLGYPTPVLINYGDHEAEDGYVQHLAKVEGILRYLEQMESSVEFAEDLVLIIDGYDIWFQLRPDVLIKRFYAINAAADARTIARFGEKLFIEREMYQSVVFGPDKLCWPVDLSRPACWAVPDSTMSDYAFGPLFEHEDRDKNPAKWLNSGTVMGTTRDLKDIFHATLEAIQFNHVTDSDQYYFANLWGDQEFERLRNRPDLLEKAKSKLYYDSEDPNNNRLVRTEPITFGKRTEYHIGIDYDSTMFQTLAFWKGQLAWTREIDSWSPPAGSHSIAGNLWEFNLAEDILASRPPFESIDHGVNHTNSTPPGWESVELAYNILTRQHPVLMHVTGNAYEKNYREYWWTRMWFQKKAEKLRLATHRLDEQLITKEPIANLLWYNAEPTEDADEILDRGKGGAWTDRRGWLSWRRLCKASEEEIYGPSERNYYHPSPQPSAMTFPGASDATADWNTFPGSQAWDGNVQEGQPPPAQAPDQAMPGFDPQPQAAAPAGLQQEQQAAAPPGTPAGPPGTPAEAPAAVEMPPVIAIEQVAKQPAPGQPQPPAPLAQAARAAQEEPGVVEGALREPVQRAAR